MLFQPNEFNVRSLTLSLQRTFRKLFSLSFVFFLFLVFFFKFLHLNSFSVDTVCFYDSSNLKAKKDFSFDNFFFQPENVKRILKTERKVIKMLKSWNEIQHKPIIRRHKIKIVIGIDNRIKFYCDSFDARFDLKFVEGE